MNAPLRIIKSREDNAGEILSRIVKLAPSEVVGLYLLGKGYATGTWLGYWSLICLGLVLVFRIWGTHSQIWSVVISFFSFGIWVLAMGDPILTFTLSAQFAALLVLVFTFVVPIFYKGDPE